MSATFIYDGFAPLRFVVVHHAGGLWASVGSLCTELGLDVATRVADLHESRGHWATPLELPACGVFIPLEQVPFFLVCVEPEDVPPEKVEMLRAMHRRIGEACRSPAMGAVTLKFLESIGVQPASRAALETAERIVDNALRAMRRRSDG